MSRIPDIFVNRSIFSTANFSETSPTEGHKINFKRTYFNLENRQLTYLVVVFSRYLLHYVLSYNQNENALTEFAGFAIICVFVGLIATGTFILVLGFSVFCVEVLLYNLLPTV